jgi:O-antigen/teichoic acid export membrane protein
LKTSSGTGAVLLRDSGIYLLGNLMQKATAFVLIPLYTTRLSTAQYGLVDLAGTVLNLALVAAALGVPAAINKCLHRDCPDEASRRRLLGTVSLFTLAAALVLGGAAWWAQAPLSRLIFPGPDGLMATRYTIIWLTLAQCAQIPFEYLRASGRSHWYVGLSLSQLVAQTTCTVILVVQRGWAVEGVLAGNIAGLAVVNVLGGLALLPRADWGIDRHLLRALTSYGLAMVPVFVSGWIVNLSDRFFLSAWAGLSALGVYSLGYKFGALLDLLLVMPFQRAWTPIFFRMSHDADAPETLSRVATYLGAALSFAALGVSLAVPPFLRLGAGKDFRGAGAIVPLVCFAYILGGLANCFGNGLIVAERVRLIAAYAGLAAAAKLVFSALLIPWGGSPAAAGATILAFGVQLLGVLRSLRRHYPVPVEWRRILGSFVAAAVPLGISLLLPELPLLADVAVRLALLSLFPLIVVLLRLPRPEEVSALARLVHAWPARRRA